MPLIAADALSMIRYTRNRCGKEAIMEDLDASFAAIPDAHYEILKLLTKDRDAVVEFRITGRILVLSRALLDLFPQQTKGNLDWS